MLFFSRLLLGVFECWGSQPDSQMVLKLFESCEAQLYRPSSCVPALTAVILALFFFLGSSFPVSPNRETQAETVAFLRRVLLRHSQGMKLGGKSILGLPSITHKVSKILQVYAQIVVFFEICITTWIRAFLIFFFSGTTTPCGGWYGCVWVLLASEIFSE